MFPLSAIWFLCVVLLEIWLELLPSTFKTCLIRMLKMGKRLFWSITYWLAKLARKHHGCFLRHWYVYLNFLLDQVGNLGYFCLSCWVLGFFYGAKYIFVGCWCGNRIIKKEGHSEVLFFLWDISSDGVKDGWVLLKGLDLSPIFTGFGGLMWYEARFEVGLSESSPNWSQNLAAYIANFSPPY